jgi:3-oxoacyl-[acyl-carrier protein] reductase
MTAVLDKDSSACKALTSALPNVFALECDLADSDMTARAIAGCVEKLGGLDVLINNAGRIFSSPLIRLTSSGVETHSPHDWNSVLDANLNSVFNATSHAAAYMVRHRVKGIIVNISSISAAGNPGQSAYAAAKAGVNALTATWAKELAPLRIRVAGLAPGFSDTQSTHSALSAPVLEDTVSKVPLKRLGKPEEIADGVIWILKNDYYCGKILELDGGLII